MSTMASRWRYWNRQLLDSGCSGRRRSPAWSSFHLTRSRACDHAAVSPVVRCVRPDQTGWSPSPTRGIHRKFGPLLKALRRTKRGPRRNPAERFLWGEAEQRNERVFALLGGNEGYEASDDDKQDKDRGRLGLPRPVTSARSAGSYRGLVVYQKRGQNTVCAITSAVVIPQRLEPQQKIRGHAPERNLF